MTQSFPLKTDSHLELSNADRYCQNDIVFDFNTARMCPTRSITMQCGLSGGKQKLTVTFVQLSSMQVTKGTWALTRTVCTMQALLLPHTRAREQG